MTAYRSYTGIILRWPIHGVTVDDAE